MAFIIISISDNFNMKSVVPKIVYNFQFEIFLKTMSVISHTHISGNVAICPTCPLKGISAHLYQLDESGQRLAKPLQSLHLSEER